MSPALPGLRANPAVTALLGRSGPSAHRALPAAQIRAWLPKASLGLWALLAHKDPKDRLVRRVLRVRKVLPDIRVLKVPKVLRDHGESPALPVSRDLRDLPDPSEPQVL